jgi:hypothetical protein
MRDTLLNSAATNFSWHEFDGAHAFMRAKALDTMPPA